MSSPASISVILCLILNQAQQPAESPNDLPVIRIYFPEYTVAISISPSHPSLQFSSCLISIPSSRAWYSPFYKRIISGSKIKYEHLINPSEILTTESVSVILIIQLLYKALQQIQWFSVKESLPSSSYPPDCVWAIQVTGRTAIHFSTVFRRSSTYSTSSNFFRQV